MPDSKATGPDDLHDAAIRVQACADLPELVDTVVAEFKSMLEAEHVFVYLHDTKWKDLHGRRTPDEDEIRFPVGRGIAGSAFKRGKVVSTQNAPEERAYVAEIDSPPVGDARSLLAVPIPDAEGDPLGVFEALSSCKDGFGKEQKTAARLMARHVGIALGHAQERKREKQFVLDLASALAGAVDRLVLSTVDHAWRVREYCRRLANAAGLDDRSRNVLETAAALHDFGRSELHVREQPDGTLDASAVEMLKPHVLLMEALLRNVPFPERLAEVPEIILCHHEFMDGSGYPRGKSGDEIPRLARMLAVADGFDACLYGRRPKVRVTKSGRIVPGAKSGMPDAEAEALEYLKRGAGKLFDATVVRLFVDNRCYSIEQRRFPRIEFEAPAEVVIIGPGGEETRRFETQALDISEGGVLFRAAEPIAPHTLVRLTITLPSERVDAIAKVARILPGSPDSDDDPGKRIGAYFLWYGTRET